MLPKTNTQKAILLKPLISQQKRIQLVVGSQLENKVYILLVWDLTNSVFYDSCDLPAEAILEFRCIYSCVKECVAKTVMHSDETRYWRPTDSPPSRFPSAARQDVTLSAI